MGEGSGLPLYGVALLESLTVSTLPLQSSVTQTSWDSCGNRMCVPWQGRGNWEEGSLCS